MQRTQRSDKRITRNVSANMKAEGFHVSAETMKACEIIASGKNSASQLIKARLSMYSLTKK